MRNRSALFAILAVIATQAAGAQFPPEPVAPLGANPAAPVSAAAATPLPHQPVFSPADRDKVLSPGDTVTLQIAEDRDEPVMRRISDTGELEVPHLGRVRVAGKSCATVAAEIKRLLEADYYHRATVRIAIDQVNRAASLGKIYLSGLVKAPGPQPIFTGEVMTASAAILRAGGFAQFANTRKVKLVRKLTSGQTREWILDMKAVLEEGKLSEDFELRDGDLMIVPQRAINW